MLPVFLKTLQIFINVIGVVLLFFMLKGLSILQIILIPISLFMICLEINCIDKNQENA